MQQFMEDITKRAIAFVCRCYNSPNAATVTEARTKAWLTNIGRKSTLKVLKLVLSHLPWKPLKKMSKRLTFNVASGKRLFKNLQIWILLNMDGLEIWTQNLSDQSCCILQVTDSRLYLLSDLLSLLFMLL